MQDTTRLEAHYAQLLTQAELDLYTVSTKDKEAYASIQETLITLGSMLEENLGYMNQAKVRSTYALQHMSVLQLGALSSDNLGIDWGGVDPDNNLTEQQRRAIEVDTLASQLTFEFSQGYSSSTAKTLPRVLTGRQNKGLLSASPAYNFFKGFFDAYTSGSTEDFETLQENAAYMRDVKRVSSQVMRNGYDSVDSRVNILADDYVRQLISPESPISSQARFLVSDLSTVIGDNELYDTLLSGIELSNRDINRLNAAAESQDLASAQSILLELLGEERLQVAGGSFENYLVINNDTDLDARNPLEIIEAKTLPRVLTAGPLKKNSASIRTKNKERRNKVGLFLLSLLPNRYDSIFHILSVTLKP